MFFDIQRRNPGAFENLHPLFNETTKWAIAFFVFVSVFTLIGAVYIDITSRLSGEEA